MLRKSIFILIFTIRFMYGQEPFFTTSTRALALGNSFVGKANLENLVFFNSAALGFNKEMYLSFNIINQDYEYKNTVINIPLNYSDFSLSGMFIRDNLGLTMSYRIKGNKYYHSIYSSPPALIDSFDTSPLEKSRSLYYEYNLFLSYGKRIFKNISVGLSLKLLHSKTDNYGDKINFFDKNTYAASVDFGVLVQLSNQLIMGMTIDNFIKTAWRYAVLDYLGYPIILGQTPTSVNIGFNLNFGNTNTILIDVKNIFGTKVDKQYNGYKFHPSIHLGYEHKLYNSTSARVGYMYYKFPKNFFEDIQTYELVYKPTHFYSFGISTEYNRLVLELAVSLNDRKKEIINLDVTQGKVVLEGYTFHYSSSIGYNF